MGYTKINLITIENIEISNIQKNDPSVRNWPKFAGELSILAPYLVKKETHRREKRKMRGVKDFGAVHSSLSFLRSAAGEGNLQLSFLAALSPIEFFE